MSLQDTKVFTYVPGDPSSIICHSHATTSSGKQNRLQKNIYTSLLFQSFKLSVSNTYIQYAAPPISATFKKERHHQWCKTNSQEIMKNQSQTGTLRDITQLRDQTRSRRKPLQFMLSTTKIRKIMKNRERMHLRSVYTRRQTEIEETSYENCFDISRCCHGIRDSWAGC